MYSELEKFQAKYLDILSAHFSEVHFLNKLQTVLPKRRVFIAFDMDYTTTAPHSQCATENWIDCLPSRIDISAIKSYFKKSMQDPSNIKTYHAAILRELEIGKLTIWEDRETSIKAAIKTIPVEGCHYGVSRLKRYNCLPTVLSAGGRFLVNAFSEIKLGISSFVNEASKYIYHPITGVSTGECEFCYNEIRAARFIKKLEWYGGISSMSLIVDDTLLHTLLAKASAGGVYVCVSSDERMKQLEKNNPYGLGGPIFVYNPGFRNNFNLIVDEVIKMRGVRAVRSFIPPTEMRRIIRKINFLRYYGRELEGSGEIKFLVEYDDFLNPLVEISNVEELQFKKEKFDREIRRIRTTNALSDKKDAIASIVQGLESYLFEHGIDKAFEREIDKLACEQENIQAFGTNML